MCERDEVYMGRCILFSEIRKKDHKKNDKKDCKKVCRNIVNRNVGKEMKNE